MTGRSLIRLRRTAEDAGMSGEFMEVKIQKRGDWERFQRLIRETEDGSEKSEYNPGIYRVTDPALNIRTGPGVEYPVVGVIKDQGSYTITEIRNKSWGRLLSGAGWINCHKAYCFYGGRV